MCVAAATCGSALFCVEEIGLLPMVSNNVSVSTTYFLDAEYSIVHHGVKQLIGVHNLRNSVRFGMKEPL